MEKVLNWFKKAQFDDVPIVEISKSNGSYFAIVNGDPSRIKGYISPINGDSWMITEDGRTPVKQYSGFMEAYDAFVEYIKKALHSQGFPNTSRRREHELV